MPRKTTAVLIAALGINFALAGGAMFLANLNQPTGFDAEIELAGAQANAGDIDSVAGVGVDTEAGDLAVPIKAAQRGGNTRVTFTCGKATPAGREVHEGTWGRVGGAVLYRPEAQGLRAVEAVFDVRSLRTDAQGLTNTVTVKDKWFDYENHPTATYTCDRITPIDAATPSHTHDLVGSFTLNGITKPVTIPAALSFSGQSMTLDAAFTILRSDFDVQKRASSLAGALGNATAKVDDEVELTVRITASPDPMAVISELAQIVEDQQEQLRIAGAERDRLKSLGRKIELLQEQVDKLAVAGPANTPAVDTAALPGKYTDQAPRYGKQIDFDMVLVPGDTSKGIAPFYMSAHEVRWSMIDMWMYTGDLKGKLTAAEVAKLIEQDLRPSPLYEEPAQIVQVKDKDNPAMAMSMITAKAYCKWLSEKTGRRYRLPTLDEWMHAMRLGGGRPDNLDDYAWHKDNHRMDEYLTEITGTVGSKKPNSLGIYDLFGNVAEWVTGTGEDRVVVGGTYKTPPDEITEDWREVASQEVWNANYPQEPKSRFWYSDFYFSGIRLVCDVQSVASNPPGANE